MSQVITPGWYPVVPVSLLRPWTFAKLEQPPTMTCVPQAASPIDLKRYLVAGVDVHRISSPREADVPAFRVSAVRQHNDLINRTTGAVTIVLRAWIDRYEDSARLRSDPSMAVKNALAPIGTGIPLDSVLDVGAIPRSEIETELRGTAV